MKRTVRIMSGLIAVFAGLLLAISAGAGAPIAGAVSSESGETIIELRLWQDVADPENLYVSARPSGGDWEELGTFPFVVEGYSGYALQAEHRHGTVAVGGVAVRIWQRVQEPARIFVRACGSVCQGSEPYRSSSEPGRPLAWGPLGMMPLPLDDGHNKTGRFRYGDLTVAVPANNPALLADREHLLALKKTLEGGIETGLNWSAASTTTTWEGVTVEGTPPRVTKLRLSDRGLAGELWGWIGELTELTELHLDDNALDGFLPSKLGRLTKLTSLRLGGNGFDDRQQGFRGCVPPSLYNVAENDAGTLALSPCTAPANALPGTGTESLEQERIPPEA